MDRQRESSREQSAALREDEIDTSDIPEVTDWSGAEVGKFYRPIKKQITLRIDGDVLDWFKSQGSGYQTTINSALRAHMARALKGFRVRTGDACPESGVWVVVGSPSRTVAIARGEVMPPVGRKSVVWCLARRSAE